MKELSKERLQQMHLDNLLLLSGIADAEKRLEKMRLEAQQLNIAIVDKLEDEK